MPVYEYACTACSHEFEEWQKITDPPVKVCPKCKKKKVERLISRTSFQLKGGGWYSDLYSSKSADKPGSKADDKSDAKPDAKAAPADAASKPDTAAKADKADKSDKGVGKSKAAADKPSVSKK